MALGAVTYASFITLRGLWLGPLLIERYGFSLLQSGNVALAVSVASLFGPPVFGRLDTMGAARRPRIVGFSLLMAAAFAVLAFVHAPWRRRGRDAADRLSHRIHRLAVRGCARAPIRKR